MSPTPETFAARQNEISSGLKRIINCLDRVKAIKEAPAVPSMPTNVLVFDQDGDKLCVHPGHYKKVSREMFVWIPNARVRGTVETGDKTGNQVTIKWGKAFDTKKYPYKDTMDGSEGYISIVEMKRVLENLSTSTVDIETETIEKWERFIGLTETGLKNSGFIKEDK